MSLLPDRAPGDRTRVERTVWPNCGAGASLTLNKIVGGGHTRPGGIPVAPPSIVGKVSQELGGVEEIRAFFMRHRRTI